ncbi:insulin-like growth factor-binding protein 6 [Thalassophryne amazonica]|uniref:insulin-like growth factor-binding protein 6 n=1 Tax=Thalassophryne amazonica TaxID=390379 RepID=UPI00147139CD|nr:insulin-like growth factor-binding protein 6 [Thalassophryne amazonica]
MFLYLNLMTLLLLQPVISKPRLLDTVTAPPRECLTCEGNTSQSQPSGELTATDLSVGAPCGVYTQRCMRGLRCTPPLNDPRPLRALLEGRGICSSSTSSNISPTERIQTVDVATTKYTEEAPCRKLLTLLVKGLDLHLFKSHHDIYMPNCDTRGFFRKKQCWSSRGKMRGKCWCVDENGMPFPSYIRQKSTLTCPNA